MAASAVGRKNTNICIYICRERYIYISYTHIHVYDIYVRKCPYIYMYLISLSFLSLSIYVCKYLWVHVYMCGGVGGWVGSRPDNITALLHYYLLFTILYLIWFTICHSLLKIMICDYCVICFIYHLLFIIYYVYFIIHYYLLWVVLIILS